MPNFLWTRFVVIFLGIWLFIAPLTFEYSNNLMYWNDLIIGLLLINLGLFSLKSECGSIIWSIAIIGLWLQLAPLIFWASTSFMYLNDTIIGVAIVCFSILIPGAPGENTITGPKTPPGWSYNPSSWIQRFPIVLFALAGWFVARYMAAYQLGYRDTVYDPVFGNGTLEVITSKVSQAFPVSDAGLGAAAYTIEALMGLHGGERRWYTMPWNVVFFGILVVPLGLVSITLVILQPVLVGHWCFWCLLTAICMLLMISLTVDEVIAVLQYLYRVKKSDLPFWSVFWKGGPLMGDTYDEPLPAINTSLRRTFPEMVKGVTPPWNLICTALIGGFLMASPTIFGERGIGADFDYIVGALTITFSIISWAEVTRAARFILILFALWIGSSPLESWGNPNLGMYSDAIFGILLILLSIRKGPIRHRYGNWDRFIF